MNNPDPGARLDLVSPARSVNRNPDRLGVYRAAADHQPCNEEHVLLLTVKHVAGQIDLLAQHRFRTALTEERSPVLNRKRGRIGTDQSRHLGRVKCLPEVTSSRFCRALELNVAGGRTSNASAVQMSTAALDQTSNRPKADTRVT